MPPRIPVVFLFVTSYFAMVWGGGAAAPAREAIAIGFTGAPDWLRAWFGLPELRLSFADIAALGAAFLALPDAALRPSRALSDRIATALCALAAFGALAVEPLLISPGYVILLALSLGDVVSALGHRGDHGPAPRPS